MELQQLRHFRGGPGQGRALKGAEEIVQEDPVPVTVARLGSGRAESCRRLLRVRRGLVGPGRDSRLRAEKPGEVLPYFYQESSVGPVCSEVVSLFPGVHSEVDQPLVLTDSLVTDVSCRVEGGRAECFSIKEMK